MKDIKDEISLLYEIENPSQNTSDDLVQKQLRVLKNLQSADRKDAVAALAPLLDRRTAITGHLRKTIVELIKLYNARDYLALDVRVRESLWSYHWSYQPVHAIDDGIPNDDALLVYGIYSMHRSGYVREKAVRALSQYNSSKTIPFLLLRVTDWVPQVSKLASEALKSTLMRSSHIELIFNLPLVNHIRTYGRGDNDHLLSTIDSQICEEASHEDLAAGMKSSIREVRRALMKLLPQKGPNFSLALEALDDPDPIVRSLAFQKVSTSEILPGETLRILCRSKYTDQRRLAYTYVARMTNSEAKEILIEGLTDRSSSVRNICQYFLARKFQFDSIRYYEDRLPEPGAILGLGEMDSKGSALRIETLLEGSLDPRVVCAALITLGKADTDSYWEIFLSKARSENMSVSVQALKQLLRCGRLAPDLLMELHLKHDEPIRRVMIRLARKLSKWSALSTLLQLYIQENCLQNKQLIVDFLSAHAENQKRIFTRPTRIQSKFIRSSIPLIDMLPSDVRDEILLDLREFEN